MAPCCANRGLDIDRRLDADDQRRPVVYRAIPDPAGLFIRQT